MRKLEELLTTYPVFQPNQLLTSEQLNTVVEYLEQQERLTRQRLIGIGIVCGLEARIGADYSIHITKGVGVTSEGYLITFPEDKKCTRVVDFKKDEYEPFKTTGAIKEVLEESEVVVDSNAPRLRREDLRGKALVLYLEISDTEVAKCVVNDCDERGKKREFRVRKLLVAREDAEKLVQDGWQNPCSIRHSIIELPAVEIPRFLPSKVEDRGAFVEGYRAVILEAATTLEEALIRLYRLFKPLFAGQYAIEHGIRGLKDRVLELVDRYPRGVQYIYDHLRDVKKAYDELLSMLRNLVARCSPDTGLFPRHLVLGRLEAIGSDIFDPNVYKRGSSDRIRTCFIPSPIHDGQRELLQNIGQQIQRLALMLEGFDLEGLLEGELPVKVIPTKDCSHGLGKQAIPFYYAKAVKELSHYWDFETTVMDRVKEKVRGYHLNDEQNNPLLLDICGYPKLRIEGHVGKRVDVAVEELKRWRREFNLDFDIITLKLNGDSQRLYLPDDTKIADLKTLYSLYRSRLVCCIDDMRSILGTEKSRYELYLVTTYLIYRTILSEGRGVSLNRLEASYNRMKALYEQAGLLLAQYVEGLPEDLKELSIARLFGAQYMMELLCSNIRQYIYSWRTGETRLAANPNERIITTPLFSTLVNEAEVFINMLIEGCPLTPFGAISDCFTQRVERLSLFSRFNEAISGMEHIAGTMWGGTFILVYEDTIPKKTVRLSTTIGTAGGDRPLKGVEYVVFTGKDNAVESVIKKGRTNQKGEAQFEMPQVEAMVLCYKQGFQPVIKKLGPAQRTLKIRMKPLIGRVELPLYRVAPATNIRVVSRLTTAGYGLLFRDAGFVEDMLTNMERYRKIDFSSAEGFVVVADFYLPCKIRDNHFELPAIDGCVGEYSKRNLVALMESAIGELRKDKNFAALILEREEGFPEIRNLLR